jgi:hypothetical protein
MIYIYIYIYVHVYIYIHVYTCAEPAPDILANFMGLALASPSGKTDDVRA